MLGDSGGGLFVPRCLFSTVQTKGMEIGYTRMGSPVPSPGAFPSRSAAGADWRGQVCAFSRGCRRGAQPQNSGSQLARGCRDFSHGASGIPARSAGRSITFGIPERSAGPSATAYQHLTAPTPP